jgi:hypothetical protein
LDTAVALKKFLQGFKIWGVNPNAPPQNEMLHGPSTLLGKLLRILVSPLLLIGSYLDILNPYNGKKNSEYYRYSQPD